MIVADKKGENESTAASIRDCTINMLFLLVLVLVLVQVIPLCGSEDCKARQDEAKMSSYEDA